MPLARDAEKTFDLMVQDSKEKKACFKSKGDDKPVKLWAELWAPSQGDRPLTP